MSKTTQRDQIRAYLCRGRTITHLESEDLFGCMRLAARINELRKEGMEIETYMKSVPTRTGTTSIAQYSLKKGLQDG